MQDIPDPRDVDLLLVEAGRLADRCRIGIAADDIGESYEAALSIMLELRVPRTPETEQEWNDMLARSMDGPSYGSEETFEMIRRHGEMFTSLLSDYRKAVRSGDWRAAIRLLGTTDEGSLTSWNGHDVGIASESEATTITATTADGRTVLRHVVGGTHAGAAIAAVMDAHVLRRELWKR